MKFDHPESNTSYEIPDVITVRMQLRYISLASSDKADRPERHWDAAKSLITGWKSDLIKDIEKIDLDKETDINITALITSVSMRVKEHIYQLGAVEKKA